MDKLTLDYDILDCTGRLIVAESAQTPDDASLTIEHDQDCVQVRINLFPREATALRDWLSAWLRERGQES